jgi:hypothetical protein
MRWVPIAATIAAMRRMLTKSSAGRRSHALARTFAHARRVVRVVGPREAVGEAGAGAGGLQHAHAGDAFGHLRVDVAAQRA